MSADRETHLAAHLPWLLAPRCIEKGRTMNLSVRKKRPSTLSASPFNGDLARLRDEMDLAFSRVFADPFGFAAIEPKALRAEGWAPAIDVSETDAEVTVR